MLRGQARKTLQALLMSVIILLVSGWLPSPSIRAGCQDGVVVSCTKNGKLGTKTCVNGRWTFCEVEDGPPIPTPTPAPPPPLLSLHYYFGDLHTHTNFSDGTSDMVDSITSTLNKIKYLQCVGVDASIDFMAITDHGGSLEEDEFKGILENAKRFTLYGNDPKYPGIHFVVIPGFELGSWGGHENLFNVEANGVVYAGNYPDGWLESLSSLEGYVKNKGNIVQLNHPAPGLDFNGFTQPDRSQVWSNTALIELPIGDNGPVQDGFFQALARGWHVAPTMNSDWHDPNIWERWDGDFRTAIVTKAPGLDPFVIYRAMRQRNVYATEDKNLEIDFRINGQQMGSTVYTSEDAVHVEVGIRDPDWVRDPQNNPGESIDHFELYVNGYLLQRRYCGQGPDCRDSFDLLLNPGDYSFIKVFQADGQRAWTAPIFVSGS